MQCLVSLLNILFQFWQVYFLHQSHDLVVFFFFSWIINTPSLIETLPVCFCYIYPRLPQHSEFIICEFGQWNAFSFPKQTLERTRSIEPRTQHFLGPPGRLTSTVWSQFNIWPSGCFWNMWLWHTSLALELLPVLAPLLRVIWLLR